MTTNAERKFVNLRKRLDQLGYRQPLGIESLPLVEKLFSDLVHTTESLRNAKLSSGKTDRDGGSLETVLEPYRSENARLVRENNQLHLGLLALREEKDQLCLELKASIRKLEQETTDLKFLNNQYVFKVRALEQEGRAKTERIQQLQEKNLQAVVQTPGGKKRAIPFRRQRMQIDELVPPSTSCQLTMPPPDDLYVADLLQVADDRIQELQQDVARLKQELERTQGGIKHLNTQVEDRDREIERLGRALDGGRPHDVISLEARTISNEKLIAHLNLQVEYLQETNGDLKLQLQQLQEHKQSASSQVADLSAKNQELCQELSHIDHLAQQMERDKELVLETADQELLDAKKEIQRQHRAIEDLEDVITRLKRERAESDYEKDQLRNKLTEMGEQGEKMEGLINFLEEEKMRLREKVEKMTDTEKDLVVELEKMRSRYGVCGKEHSPSRLDIFIRSLEDERDFYRLEVERLGKSRAGGGAGRSPARGRSPSQGGLHNRGHSCELELVRAVKERDELQATLQGFEKHMEDIQANVKLLTAERDKLSSHLRQVQKELVQVQEVAKCSPGLQERFDADLQRMAAERDALRERLKIIQTDKNTEREEEDGRILSLESTIQTLTREKSDLWCQVSALRESRVAVEAEFMARAAEEAAQQRAEASALRLLQEQMEHTISDSQHQLSVKINELHAAHKQIDKLEEKIADLNRLSSSCGDEVTILQKTVLALDREKDTLQETVDQKTEIIEALEEDVANKEKTLVNVKITINDMENSLQNLQGALGSREREISSLRRQLDVAQQELTSISRELEIALRENRRLQDDLATMTRENQTVHTEMDEIMREKEELKMRVHSYIAEVARIESVIAIKERENRDILEHFRAAHAQADDWELKVQQAEGLNNSIRLELLSADTERRHLRERLVNLDQEIQEHMSAQQAYELQVSSLAKSMSLLEEELQRTAREKDSAHADLLAVRELCVKLDSSKERVSRQLTSKSMELERVLGELEDVRSETELLKNQLSSERLAVKNLETLLSSNRQKEFQTHLSASEKECELKVLRDRLALADSKTAGQTREVSQLRGKVSQLQTELDVLRRQLTTERFERERAVQEMRRQGVSFSSLRSSSPQNSSLSPRPLSPEHSDLNPPERSTGTTSDKSVSFKE